MEVSISFPTDRHAIRDKDIHHVRPFSTFNSATARNRPVSAIVAYASDRAIGFKGDIPWRLPEDMAHFKKVTMGHPVIMGRRTWESIPKRPLPGRLNMVVSRNPDYSEEGAEVFGSIEEALAAVVSGEIPFIIGGAEIYKQSLPLCSRVYVTLVDTVVPEADAHFPELSADEWDLIEESPVALSRTGLNYRFLTYQRRK